MLNSTTHICYVSTIHIAVMKLIQAYLIKLSDGNWQLTVVLSLKYAVDMNG